tara:strand:+ start:235 stop:336 length:102 start_codon:yes stop_codon:yes gene_type:complete
MRELYPDPLVGEAQIRRAIGPAPDIAIALICPK